MKTNYLEQYETAVENIREAAEADIRKYIERYGEFKALRRNSSGELETISIKLDTPYLVIGDAASHLVDMDTICILADTVNIVS